MTWRYAWLLTLMTGACSQSATTPSTDDRELRREIGFLAYYDLSGSVEVRPDGDSLRIRIVTVGGGCASQGELEITRNGDMLIITPYDSLAYGNWVCPAIVRPFEHEVMADGKDVSWVTIKARKYPSLEEMKLEYGLGTVPL